MKRAICASVMTFVLLVMSVMLTGCAGKAETYALSKTEYVFATAIKTETINGKEVNTVKDVVKYSAEDIALLVFKMKRLNKTYKESLIYDLTVAEEDEYFAKKDDYLKAISGSGKTTQTLKLNKDGSYSIVTKEEGVDEFAREDGVFEKNKNDLVLYMSGESLSYNEYTNFEYGEMSFKKATISKQLVYLDEYNQQFTAVASSALADADKLTVNEFLAKVYYKTYIYAKTK